MNADTMCCLQVRHQRVWVQRLTTGLRTGNVGEVSAWLAHHKGLLGRKDDLLVTRAFWYALKVRQR